MILEKELTILENNIEFMDLRNVNVSEREVAWHIDHSLRVVDAVLIALKKSDPSSYSSKFNVYKSLFLRLGWFPRGRVKAPKSVVNNGMIKREILVQLLSGVRTKLNQFDQLDEKSYFKHPVFGNIIKKESYAFMQMHTYHHIKIIRDIVA